MLQDLFGAQLELPARVAVALVVIAALLGLTMFLVRRLGGGGGRSGIARSRHRLAVLDSVAVDQRRRLVLVRRDEVEHLLLVGGTADVVVESAIGRPSTRDAAPHREALPHREPMAQRESLPPREGPGRDALPARAPQDALPARTPPSGRQPLPQRRFTGAASLAAETPDPVVPVAPQAEALAKTVDDLPSEAAQVPSPPETRVPEPRQFERKPSDSRFAAPRAGAEARPALEPRAPRVFEPKTPEPKASDVKVQEVEAPETKAPSPVKDEASADTTAANAVPPESEAGGEKPVEPRRAFLARRPLPRPETEGFGIRALRDRTPTLSATPPAGSPTSGGDVAAAPPDSPIIAPDVPATASEPLERPAAPPPRRESMFASRATARREEPRLGDMAQRLETSLGRSLAAAPALTIPALTVEDLLDGPAPAAPEVKAPAAPAIHVDAPVVPPVSTVAPEPVAAAPEPVVSAPPVAPAPEPVVTDDDASAHLAETPVPSPEPETSAPAEVAPAVTPEPAEDPAPVAEIIPPEPATPHPAPPDVVQAAIEPALVIEPAPPAATDVVTIAELEFRMSELAAAEAAAATSVSEDAKAPEAPAESPAPAAHAADTVLTQPEADMPETIAGSDPFDDLEAEMANLLGRANPPKT